MASLATLEPGTGSPYASMLTVATETDGTPVFLISRLALHTRNLENDPRASILFTAVETAADPLALGRVSVMGRAERTQAPLARERFLARHPEAAGYADFADFSFWRLTVEKAHFVGGFGRIRTLEDEALIRRGEAIRAWDAGIAEMLARLNADHGALLARLAAAQGRRGEMWRLAACDPDGADLIGEGGILRLAFARPVESVHHIGEALQQLADDACHSS